MLLRTVTPCARLPRALRTEPNLKLILAGFGSVLHTRIIGGSSSSRSSSSSSSKSKSKSK